MTAVLSPLCKARLEDALRCAKGVYNDFKYDDEELAAVYQTMVHALEFLLHPNCTDKMLRAAHNQWINDPLKRSSTLLKAMIRELTK